MKTTKGNMSDKVYMVPNPATPNEAVRFDPERCDGCNLCVGVCRADVLMPNPERGKPPIVLYPDECWYGGCCVVECPKSGAIEMLHPLNQSIVVNWRRKDTGEDYRLGMRNPPPANTKPPAR